MKEKKFFSTIWSKGLHKLGDRMSEDKNEEEKDKCSFSSIFTGLLWKSWRKNKKIRFFVGVIAVALLIAPAMLVAPPLLVAPMMLFIPSLWKLTYTIPITKSIHYVCLLFR